MTTLTEKTEKSLKGSPGSQAQKLDKTKPTDIKEVLYVSKQVETSIALLLSNEHDVVMEALLFLSKYADIHKNNLDTLIKNDIIEKLCKNFQKNLCILRLSLRLLGNIVATEQGLYEIDQDMYVTSILEIVDMFTNHKDNYVREFSAGILAQLATSCRINVLIFKSELYSPILDILKSSKNQDMVYNTLFLFSELVDVPAAICLLPSCPKFDLNIIVSLLNSKTNEISKLAVHTVDKLTKACLPFLQEEFRKISIMERMFKIIMNEEKSEQHDVALKVVANCLNAQETSWYFVESIEFLDLSQWVRTCDSKFLRPLIEVFIKLTSIPEIKQVLFDLSVEESILYFFRYNDKEVINKTCEAVSNMTSHKYCCEHMLTAVIAKTLISTLQRQNDEVDPLNEVCLKTIFHFIRRNVKALDMFMEYGFKPVILDYFFNKKDKLSIASYTAVVEIIYICSAHPLYKDQFINVDILNKLLNLFQEDVDSSLCIEALSNFVSNEMFRSIFLEESGPSMIITKLDASGDVDIIIQILYFIFACLTFEDLAMALLKNGLISVLKNFSAYMQEKAPIIKKVQELALTYYPPLKFFEFGKIRITEKLPNRFYVINGTWLEAFPFLEILEIMKVSPLPTILLVDYSLQVVKGKGTDVTTVTRHSVQSGSAVSAESLASSRDSLSNLPDAQVDVDIKFGRISDDVYLPRYIYHLQKNEKYIQGPAEERIRHLAEFVESLLCGPKENLTMPQKIHEYKLHIQCLKKKLGTNIIPIGYLRLGFHCERALLFKALADRICIPSTLVRGKKMGIFWNEVALFEKLYERDVIRFYVVDLMDKIGNLMLVGSREANKYCNIN